MRCIWTTIVVLSWICRLTTASARRHSVKPAHLLAYQSPSSFPANTQASVSSDDLPPDVVWQWEEHIEWMDSSFIQTHQYEEEECLWLETKPRRKLLWLGRMDGDASYKPSYRRHSSSARPASPHTLRMEQWNITLSWRENKRERESAMQFDFHENGFVRCLNPNITARAIINQATMKPSTNPIVSLLRRFYKHKNSDEIDTATFIVGKWKLAPSGVIWKMAWDDDTTYSFYADLHLNPFGKYPKMFRGMVVRDRKGIATSLLRPLVATFSGFGVGHDTADFSYKQRQFGTNSPA